MIKKRVLVITGALLAALLLAGTVATTAVLAQEPKPFSERAGLAFGRCGFGGRGILGGQWTVFDATAEALGLTPVELFTALHGGQRLEEIAAVQGVEMEDVEAARITAQTEARRAAIEQAVQDGAISQAQADWMLEGLEQGYMMSGFGRRGMRGGRGIPRNGE